MVDRLSTIPHFCGNTPISIATFMLMKDRFYIVLYISILILGFYSFKMIIEHGTAHLSQLQQ